jgi:Mg/Co/Ni transporter MgtE
MASQWSDLSLIEKLTFIESLTPSEADLVFNSIGTKKLCNVLWILNDQLKKSLTNVMSKSSAANFFHGLSKCQREKLLAVRAVRSSLVASIE